MCVIAESKKLGINLHFSLKKICDVFACHIETTVFLTKRNCVVMIYTLFESMNFTINCFPFSLFLDNSSCLDSGISCYQNVVYVFLRQLKTVSQFWRFLKMVWYSVTCVHLVPPRVFRCYDEWWWMLSDCMTIYMLVVLVWGLWKRTFRA